MSQHSGSFTVTNNTGQTIYLGSISHNAANCPNQTAISIPQDGLVNGGSLGGGLWQTETTSRDFWSWNYHVGGATGSYYHRTSKQCSLYDSDTSVTITLTTNGAVIAPNSSGSCTGSNSD